MMEKEYATSIRNAEPDSCYDEISLYDLLQILIRRRLIIIITFLTGLFIGGAYYIFSTPIFESRAVIQIGQINQIGASVKIEDPNLLVQRLKEKYKVEDDTEGLRELPFVESISYDKNGNNMMISLVAHGSTPKQTQAFLHRVTNELLSEHQQLYQGIERVYRQNYDSLIAYKTDLEKRLQQLSDKTVGLNGQSDVFRTLVMLERAKISQSLSELQLEILQVETMLNKPYTYPTELIRSPTLTIKPVEPKILYLFFAGIIAIFVGVFVAYTKEMITQEKARKKA